MGYRETTVVGYESRLYIRELLTSTERAYERRPDSTS